MLIGQDYDKIQWNVFGLELVEPNTFIGDVIIFFVAIYFFFQIKRYYSKSTFNVNWMYFYLFFAIGFSLGGFGHLFFNYTGVPGKYPAWFLGMVSSFFIERAMVSIYPKVEKRKLFLQLVTAKLVLFCIAETIVLSTLDIEAKPERGLIVPTLNSVLGLGIALGLLGAMYQQKVHVSFKYLWLGALIIVPSAIFQALKINPAQWFDRNDVSHVLLLLGLIVYFKTIKGYEKKELER